MEGRVQIDRFAVKNFRSIKECDVELAPLTVFIGPNASGKTSFVDALLFLATGLREPLQKALSQRGGAEGILRQPVARPGVVGFDLHLSSSGGFSAEFQLDLRISDRWTVSIQREMCRINEPDGVAHYYLVEEGSVSGSAPVFPPASADRIFLTNASGLPQFRSLYDFLAGLEYVEPSTPGMRQALEALRRFDSSSDAGRSMAARFRDLGRNHLERFEIVQQYLRSISPRFDRIDVEVLAARQLLLRFVERSESGVPEPFYLWQASAGLVSSSEILLSLFEPSISGGPASPVIIEEPEALLHPGAIQVMRDAFVEASRSRQVLVTTHSPDLLDDPSIPAEWIRSVRRDEEGTHIDSLDAATKSVIRDHLFTPGQLLRQGALV